MEQNKENINTKRLKTKIPLPVDPLPPVPKHLTVDKILDSGTIFSRIALKTIDNQAGPSNSMLYNSSKTGKRTLKSTPLRIDMRNVTVRMHVEEKLDWSLKVFKDIPLEVSPEPDSTVLTVSDGDSEVVDEDMLVAHRDGCSIRAKTPLFKPSALEVSRIRNIKRSLKRPHSRELQGLSPLAEERKKIEEDKARRRLSFKGRFEEYLNSPNPLAVGYIKCLDCKDDIFENLQSTETMPAKPQTSKINRACIVNWLVKVNGPGGNPAILQSACWYLDKILSIEVIAVEKLQLLASACYWIAQKLYQTGASATKLAKCANNAFTNYQLMYYEIKVLTILDFPPQPVVPHDFTAYLAWCCDDTKPGIIELAANFFVTTSLLISPSACFDSPSVVAAAAIKNALLCLELVNFLKKLEFCPLYLRARTKARNFKDLCAAQRKAVYTMSQPTFDYRAPFDHFDAPPLYLARQIVKGIVKVNNLKNKKY